MTDDLASNRKQAFKQVDDDIVGSNAAIIGNRSQLYDLSQNALKARSVFSFTIQHARVIDLAICSIYSPPYKDLKMEKLRFWFSESDPSHTDISKKFDLIYDKARSMKFITNDTKGNICKTFDDPSHLLQKCGSELKTWLNDPQPWMDRKIISTDGIVMLDYINKDKPLFEDINPTDFGLNKGKYVSLISLMQTFGIIKVTESNCMIPYLSFEIYGDRINEGLDDMLEDKFNRTIFEWCRKMPGISSEKIESLAFDNFPAYEKESVKNSISKIINEMQKNGLIEVSINNTDHNCYIVPVWLRNSILKIHPTRVESDMVRNAIRSCGLLWQSIDDLSEYPIFLENVKESLNVIGSGKDITFKEILEIDNRLKPLLVSFKSNGILGYDKDTDTFSVKGETVNILKIIPDILKISGESDLWMEFVKGKPTYESMKIDLEKASKEIHSEIADRYTAKDLEKFKEYK
ncbi:MAG: hypothetical protein O8C61_00165 [Candidatus Methanoperedens sp.]|nr:hypothetical protein [Candidatus Methanoperedens sp.]